MPDRDPRHVLVTRPEPGASRTAARLTALGYTPILAPALTVRRLPARLEDVPHVQAILLTSGNAVAAVPAVWRDRPLFAVGAATAAAARAAGCTDVRDADADAAALAALVVRACAPERGGLLLLSGQAQGAALAASLRGQGFRVHRRVAYAARPVPELPETARAALAAGRVGHALFFSAETARAFLRQVRRAGLQECLAEITAISISQPARMALEAAAWRRIRVAQRPTQDAMLACLT